MINDKKINADLIRHDFFCLLVNLAPPDLMD